MNDFDDINARGLVLVGCGRMGGAMLQGWLASGLDAGAVTVIDPNLAPEWHDRGLRVKRRLVPPSAGSNRHSLCRNLSGPST